MKDKPLSKEELKEIMDEILERNVSVHPRIKTDHREAHQNSNADNGFDIIIQRDEQK